MKELVGWLCVGLALLSLVSGPFLLALAFGGLAWFLLKSEDSGAPHTNRSAARREDASRLAPRREDAPLSQVRREVPMPQPASCRQEDPDVVDEIDRLLNS